MKGLDRLQAQHEQLLAAFDELEVTADAEPRVRLLAHIGQRLKAHAAVEEEVLYPAVEATGDRKATAAVAEGVEAHRAADVLLDEIIGTELTAAKVKVLRDLIAQHFEREEAALFPCARRLGGAALRDLDAAIEAYLERFGDGSDDSLPPESS